MEKESPMTLQCSDLDFLAPLLSFIVLSSYCFIFDVCTELQASAVGSLGLWKSLGGERNRKEGRGY